MALKLRGDTIIDEAGKTLLELTNQVSNMMNAIYPVGSLYISTKSTNPKDLFGFGTWVQTCKSRYLVGAGLNDSNTDNSWGIYNASYYNFGANARIGEPLHTLSVEEMPTHNHQQWSYSWKSDGTIQDNGSVTQRGLTWAFDDRTSDMGSSWAHNNMPPGETYYIWKRTA